MIEGKLSFLLCLLGNKKSLFRSENSKYGLCLMYRVAQPKTITQNHCHAPFLIILSFKFTYGVSNKNGLEISLTDFDHCIF